MRGDTSTSDSVTHWDGTEKQMVGYIRVDGHAHRFLGKCGINVTEPGPATAQPGHDISPGACDIHNFVGISEIECNEHCYSTPSCQAYVMSSADNKCYLKSCTAPVKKVSGKNGYVITGDHPSCDPQPIAQRALTVHPTRTVFELEIEGTLSLNVTFWSTMFTDDFVRLSRPVYYVDLDVATLDSQAHSIQVYLDLSAQHAVNTASQHVEWKAWTSERSLNTPAMQGIQLGNSMQKVLGSKGDRVNIDWGYLHLATPAGNGDLWAGSAELARASFRSTGRLPATPDSRMPRAVSDDLPALATAAELGRVKNAQHTILVAYDDIKSVNYFGNLYPGLWKQTYGSIQNATGAAYAEHDAQLAKAEAHDSTLMGKLRKSGDKYATLCALSYRQTLAATKLVWKEDTGVAWNFLKEISTNGVRLALG